MALSSHHPAIAIWDEPEVRNPRKCLSGPRINERQIISREIQEKHSRSRFIVFVHHHRVCWTGLFGMGPLVCLHPAGKEWTCWSLNLLQLFRNYLETGSGSVSLSGSPTLTLVAGWLCSLSVNFERICFACRFTPGLAAVGCLTFPSSLFFLEVVLVWRRDR